LVRFLQLVDSARPPQRADRSVGGSLPVRALRYCEPVLAASSFGFLVFLPRRFQLLWDGHEIFWRMEGVDTFQPLRQVHYPGFAEAFDAAAPEAAKGYAPSFLAASVQPGMVQIWPGSIAVTAPGWSLLVRPVANLARPSGYELFEGIIETDTWFGPLLTNIRLTRTGVPVEFDDDIPFMQVQPIRQGHYEDARMQDFSVVADMDGLTAEDWARYAETVVKPSSDPERRRGAYAARVRKSMARRAEAAE
ncbi:MAG: hypothetical protein JSS20_20015, partial [Proteobacteria bacterium]|nr:hypothetical protein [Pseudomonadota bacterium]